MRYKHHARCRKRQDLSQPRFHIHVVFHMSLVVRKTLINHANSPRKFFIYAFLDKCQANLKICSGTPRSLSVLSAAARLSCLNSFVMPSPDSPKRSAAMAARSGTFSAESVPDRLLLLLVANHPLRYLEIRGMTRLSRKRSRTGNGFERFDRLVIMAKDLPS